MDATIDVKRPIKRFWLLLKPDKKEIRNVYFYAIFNGLVYLSLPIGIQAIINLIQGGQVSTSWIVLVIFVLAGIAFNGVLTISQMRIVENLQQKIFTRAAFEFAYRIPRIKLEALYKYYAPELMNRFFDIISVQKGLAKILIDFTTASIQIAVALILLSLYHPFFIIFSLILIILIYIIFKFTFRRGLETSLEESKRKYKVAHWLEELARNNITFKLAGKTDLPLEKTDVEVSEYVQYREKHFKVLIHQFLLLIGFKVVVATGLLAIGGVLVMQQQMNIGQFVAAEIIIIMVLNSVEKLILSLENIYDVLTSLEKIAQVTDLELEKADGTYISDFCDNKGLKVEANNITFRYPDSEKNIINDLNLEVKCNEKVLIVGENNSGKSTLLHLIAGVYQPIKGFISYNEFPQGNLKLQDLRSVIGDCLMEEQLFEGTVLENIAIGRPNATMESVNWAIDNLGLRDFVKSLPQGVDTVIDPEGRKFSKGIVDKLLLARSIADRPKLLLIKDAFQSIRKEEKNRIIDFLVKEDQPWTLIAVSSDEYMASKMDRIIYLSSGEIKEEGSFSEMKNKLI
ncbi:ATP-binding cassette domain-containing protein [Paracrocinitomix mangrovi]|uniref:peptidase domain-containing ABC transporter n=1 Tax=Paracrocinitomix mangrovi TaxID=2862509 RepID=UPI001C8D37EA|nr:ATP-binding cassette domain-containing protein [Paracrocinitomix mangrovi]UKN00179.1 ATP-binding cassette domain-containing protein [Paracrocinitomix mangrovi]